MVAITVGCAAVPAAVADNQTDRDTQAKRVFEQAEAYFSGKKFLEAAGSYLATYELSSRPGLLFKAALAFEEGGEVARAIALYSRYLSEAPDGDRRNDAQARRAGLSVRLAASVRTRAKEHRASGNHRTALAELTRALELTGEIALLFDIAQAHVGNGQRVQAAAALQRILRSERSELHPRAQLELEALQESPPAGPPSLAVGLATLATGVVVAGLGGVFHAKARSTRSDIDSRLAQGNPPLDRTDPIFDDGRRDGRRAVLLYSVGGLLAAGGAFLVFRATRDPQESAPSLSITGRAVTTGWSWSF